jgi:hypothetical protein
MNSIIWLVLIGLAVIGILISVIVCICRTPDNLRGFYGAMFWTIAIFGLVGLSIAGVNIVLELL